MIFDLHELGESAYDIAKAAGCSYSAVICYLNAAGIFLGNKGRAKQVNAEYLNMALDMRAGGSRWVDIEQHIGFSRTTFQRELRAMRDQA